MRQRTNSLSRLRHMSRWVTKCGHLWLAAKVWVCPMRSLNYVIDEYLFHSSRATR